jgi:putative acetyltransferase
MRIAIEDPGQPDVVRLIEQLDAYQMPLYSPESHHGIAIATLSRPNVVFALARSADGGAVGCGAAVLGEQYAELKRMYVLPGSRGQGHWQRITRDELDTFVPVRSSISGHQGPMSTAMLIVDTCSC